MIFKFLLYRQNNAPPLSGLIVACADVTHTTTLVVCRGLLWSFNTCTWSPTCTSSPLILLRAIHCPLVSWLTVLTCNYSSKIRSWSSFTSCLNCSTSAVECINCSNVMVLFGNLCSGSLLLPHLLLSWLVYWDRISQTQSVLHITVSASFAVLS